MKPLSPDPGSHAAPPQEQVMMLSPRKSFSLFAATVAVALLGAAQLSHAAGLFADQEVDSRFKSKIIKEKAKQNIQLANNFSFTSGAPSNAQCGSQNIGNVDTGGKIGATPREVFVFAPNAINLVSGQGCK
jgi:hypothetical protein